MNKLCLLLALAFSLQVFSQIRKSQLSQIEGLSQEEFARLRLSQKKVQNLLNEIYDEKGELKKGAYRKILKNDVISDILKESAHLFKHVKDQDIKSNIRSKLSPKYQKMLDQRPKTMNSLVGLIKDDQALPNFFRSLFNPKKMKIYGLCVVFSFILSFVLKSKNAQRRVGLTKRILGSLMITFFAIFFNLAAFTFIFRTELRPVVKIIKKNYRVKAT